VSSDRERDMSAGSSLPDGARLVDATDLAATEWDALAVRGDRGHAFQSHAWGELKRASGWEIRRFRVDRDGGPVAVFSVQIRGVGQAAARRLGPFGRFVPAGLAEASYVYAPRGPIIVGATAPSAPPEHSLAAALAGVGEAARRSRAAVVTIDPLWSADGPERGALQRSGFVSAGRDVQVSRTAMLVPLFADEDEQHRLVRKSTANLVNRARRAGVLVERVDLEVPGGDSALGEMHALLEATARREGLILRDRDYQVAQWRALGEAGHATIWFAGVDGKRWVGSVTLRCGSVLHQYQAGSADGIDLREVPANHLLQWEILRWAAAQGYGCYDLGGVDTAKARGLPRDDRHPLWNLYLFKRGFGAEGVEYLPAQESASSGPIRLAWRFARGVRS
jgi:lipid II:glycine glycyltransferase (peptidoglycan interpeptide bridge formation enzyme)